MPQKINYHNYFQRITTNFNRIDVYQKECKNLAVYFGSLVPNLKDCYRSS